LMVAVVDDLLTRGVIATSVSVGPSYRAFLGEKPCGDPNCECKGRS
jgi:hypothetical protein